MQLKQLLEEIESRSSRKEYGQILAECHKLYCEQRLSLVRRYMLGHCKLSVFFLFPCYWVNWLQDSLFYSLKIRGIVQRRISEFAKKESLPSLTRSGCAYLIQVGLLLMLWCLSMAFSHKCKNGGIRVQKIKDVECIVGVVI